MNIAEKDKFVEDTYWKINSVLLKYTRLLIRF